MKNRILLSMITTPLLASFLIPAVAQASPRKYANCPEAGRIQSPPNSAGFHMSLDCKTAYVLPPAVGAIEIASYVDEIGVEAEMCSSINGSMREMGIKRKRGEAELRRIEGRSASISKEWVEIARSCLDIESLADEAETKLRANQREQADATSKIQRIDADLIQCDGSACSSPRLQRSILATRLTALKATEGMMSSAFQRYSAKRESCHAEQDRSRAAIETEKTELSARRSSIQASLTEMAMATGSLYEIQRAQPGGLMSIVISSEQAALVGEFKRLNPSLNMVFQEMPMSGVSLSFTQITDGVASGYPTLLKADVSGMPVEADHSMTRVPFAPGSASQRVAFGAAVGGSMTINRFAACQLPSTRAYGSSSAAQHRRLKDIAGLFTGTATYQYQLGVSRKIRIHYNEKQLYCLIKKNSSRSGLFRTKSSSSITESSQLNQWLTISVESEDIGFDFANRDTLLMDLRSEMLDRALLKVATSYLSKERAQLVAPEAPRADGMAADIRKQCPNLYCQAAALTLNLGSALFGGTDASSSTCESVGTSSEETFVDTQPVTAYGTQAFKIRAKD